MTSRAVIELLEPRNPDPPASLPAKGIIYMWTTTIHQVVFVCLVEEISTNVICSLEHLFEKLRDLHVYAAGTIRRLRRGFPPQLKGKLFARERRGACRWTRDGNCLCVVWKDSVDCALLATIHPGTFAGDVVQRRTKATEGLELQFM